MSSANNARLRDHGRRFRVGPTEDEDESHLPGLSPAGPLDAEVCGQAWCGHTWSAWTRLENAAPAEARGLYRIRGAGRADLVYLGEGRIRARLRAHLRRRLEEPDHPQGAAFN